MSRPLMIGTCERGTPTASVVPDRRNTRRSQPSENYRGSAQKAVQRKPAQRSPRARLPNGPTSPGSPTEECPHYPPHRGRLLRNLFPLALSHRALHDLLGDPEEAQAAGRAIRGGLWKTFMGRCV